MDKRYLLIQKLPELTTDYIELETDNLANAGEFARLEWEIEKVSMEICMLGTNLTEDELISFLDSRHINTQFEGDK